MKVFKEINTHDGAPIPHEYYRADSGEVLMRVWATIQKDGADIKLNGEWVLFDKDNKVIDFDKYGNDLSKRNGLVFEDH